MKKIYAITFLLIFLTTMLFGCMPVETEKSTCIESGGIWASFSNGCVDSCGFERGIVTVCSTAITEGCDCGPNMCWNGESCEKN